MSSSTCRFIATTACFIFFFSNYCLAQIPIAPPGYPEGPFITQDLKTPKKGEVLTEVTRKTKKRLIKEYRRKHGKNPSKRQLNKILAKKLGLRTSDSLSSGAYIVKGRRLNKKKIKRAMAQRLVSVVEENHKIYAFGLSNDFFLQLGLLWGLNNTGLLFTKEDVDVDAPEAWDITKGNPNIVVAVLDTGTAIKHPDLAVNIWENPLEEQNGIDDDNNGYIDDIVGWDFANDDNSPVDDQFHGTHVAGVIGAAQNNGRGVAGVAPNVKILPLKVLKGNGEGDTAALINAINYAVALKKQGIDIRVMNASLGGGPKTEILKKALKRANNAGIVFVAAAGNSGGDSDTEPIYPASYKVSNVISVAAIDSTGTLANFSNFGANSVHVAAPGTTIWSTIVFDLYLPFSGTSMAAPHVAGIAALVLSQDPGLKPIEVRDRIMNSIKPLSNLEGVVMAPGVVSALNALTY